MWSFLCAAVMVFYAPAPQVSLDNNEPPSNVVEYMVNSVEGDDDQQQQNGEEWFEELLEEDLKWSFALNRVLHTEASQFQDVVLVDSKRFGKVLLIDGRMQSAENDEFIYHESIIHPPLLLHENPKTIFIMGGGEGYTAREALKHKYVEKVIMCDIDEVVVNFCRAHLEANREAFSDDRLHLVFNDAKAELEKTEDKFDVIVGDVPDPIEGGPCNHLFTKNFYEQVIKPHLKDNGIFVTQAGPAGMLSHKDIFTSIYNTVKQVFKYVLAYTAHVPSYADSAGWVVASDEPLNLDAAQLDSRIQERIRGKLRYLDGAFIVSSTVMNKTIFTSLKEETIVLTEETTKFCYGHGLADNAQGNGIIEV